MDSGGAQVRACESFFLVDSSVVRANDRRRGGGSEAAE
jgi:hypothetical protein